MGARISSITRRVKRLFSNGEKGREQKMSASSVISPEKDIPVNGRSTKRLNGAGRSSPTTLVIEELPGEIVHVIFPRQPTSTVVVRDPVTKRLSRHKLSKGMRKTTGYYDGAGSLYEETRVDW